MITSISNFKETESKTNFSKKKNDIIYNKQAINALNNLNKSRQISFKGNLSKVSKNLLGDVGFNLGKKVTRIAEEATESAKSFFRRLTNQNDLPFTEKPLILPASYNELKLKDLTDHSGVLSIFDNTEIALKKVDVKIDANDKLMFNDVGHLTSHGANDLANQIMEQVNDGSLAPKEAAIRIKREWNINTTAIANTIHLLEKHGIRVYSLVEDSSDVDAFSVWHNNIPFVFLNTLKSAERSRFDAMHELGHLVLHPLGIPRDKKSEFEANAFAAEMLMPENSVINMDIKFPTISSLIKLKKNWKVSLKALIYRLNELGVITEWSNRSLLVELNKKGYDKSEPESIERETSYLLAKIFKILSEDGIKINSIAEELCLSPIEIHKLVFNLFKPISGGNTSSREKSTASLKLVD